METRFTCKSVCRVCLEEGANLSLFDDEEEMKVYMKIMACSTVQICEEDGFPSNICSICYSMLNTAFEFKQKCETSDTKLRNCMPKENLKIEENDYNFDFPEDDFFQMNDDNDSLDDVKKFDVNDDIKLFDCGDVKVEMPLLVKKIKKKRKWKASEKKSLRELKLKKRKVATKQTSGSFKKVCVSNNIASSLLESKCYWNGDNWRFNSQHVDTEKEKCEALKIKKELDEEMAKREGKKGKRKHQVKKEKAKTINLCDTCGKIFKSKYHLKYHIMLKHQVTTGNIKCQDPDCKKMFKLDHYMMRHVKRCHSTKREFICNECGKQYAFISGLKQHMKSHSENLVWKYCNFCSQKYRTQKSVDIHIRSVHTGERPSVCTLCDSAFFHDDYLKEHMRLHTGETPYKCPICKRGYAQRGNMKSHMKQHRMSELDDTTKATMKPNYLKLLRDC